MTSTLYLTNNGLLEPLGQSQVLGYLRGLSRRYSITLVTYEKDADWADKISIRETQMVCEQLGIRWLPQRFRVRPPLVAPALRLIQMAWIARREVRAQRVRLIHARSYLPAAVAIVIGRLSGVPFIFDMRALWPEELLTAGRLHRGSVLHRAIVAAERACLRRAAAVVSLTHAAVDHLKQIYRSELAGQRIVVIPTCADLERFVPAARAPRVKVIGCLGTVLSGWFRFDWLVSFLSVVARRDSGITFELTTRDDPEHVRKALGHDPELLHRVQIGSCPSDRVQEVLQGQIASVMFFTDGLGKLGSSPTRMAEILGCGLPVVANDGVGDVARIIREYRVGVLAVGSSIREMEQAWDELQQLLADPELAARCRQAAERVFSLETGTAAYAQLYSEVLAEADRARARR